MVGVAMVLVMLSAAPSPGEESGSGPPVSELRLRPRPTFGIGAAIASGLLIFDGSSIPVSGKLGFGFAVEGGVLLRDRTALTLQLMATVLPPGIFAAPGFVSTGFIVTGGGFSVDWLLSDRLSLGTGLHLHGYLGGPSTLALMLPLRVSWRPMVRESEAVLRQGFVLGFQLAPGFSPLGLSSPAYRFNMVVGGLLTIGYGWW